MKSLFIVFLSVLITITTVAKHEAREISTMKQFREIMSSKKPTFMLFYAPWCSACHAMHEPFNNLSARFNGEANIIKINADSENLKEVVDMFGIEGVPTLIIKSLGAIKNETLQSIAKIVIGPESTSPKQAPKKAKDPKKTPAKKQSQKKSPKKPYSPPAIRKK